MMKITRKILWENRSGEGTSWFHPRACSCGGGKLLMTMQSIGGSDYYGPLQQSVSPDAGGTWSDPVPVPGFAWKHLADGISEGACDVVPEYHRPTDTVLAIGHNVYYKDGKLFDSLGDWGALPAQCLRRFPVWSICRNGTWSMPQKLDVPGMEDCSKYSCGSSQRLFIGDGQVLIPLTFGRFGIRDRQVTTVLFRYDGNKLFFERQGDILSLPVGRGLLEPSLAVWRSKYLLTIRAEDDCGYHAESPDGLQWNEIAPWTFEDGERLVMSTTQQHFLHLGGKLYLVYTRKTAENAHVFRFRAPLFMAEISDAMTLKRETETTVFPLLAENGNAAGMGNFQVTEITENSALITVGEERSFDHYYGNTLAAYIRE